MFKIYLGYDHRESRAYDVAVHSMRSASASPLSITPLDIVRLESSGLLTRPRRAMAGKMFDVISDAPMATEFAISRFLTPLLAQKGWALFADSDIVVTGDVYDDLYQRRDESKAVMVVKHQQVVVEDFKMDGQVQTMYRRKNWSSVMLFNCDHPANRTLTLGVINSVPGRDLHAFCWLPDELIGELPAGWNWLVGVQPKPRCVSLAHFTLGGPWFDTWKGAQHDDIWTEAEARMQGVRIGPKSITEGL